MKDGLQGCRVLYTNWVLIARLGIYTCQVWFIKASPSLLRLLSYWIEVWRTAFLNLSLNWVNFSRNSIVYIFNGSHIFWDLRLYWHSNWFFFDREKWRLHCVSTGTTIFLSDFLINLGTTLSQLVLTKHFLWIFEEFYRIVSVSIVHLSVSHCLRRPKPISSRYSLATAANCGPHVLLEVLMLAYLIDSERLFPHSWFLVWLCGILILRQTHRMLLGGACRVQVRAAHWGLMVVVKRGRVSSFFVTA